MPYTLTETEKDDIRRKYLENVERINAFLPDGSKIRPDLKALNKRLNDPNEQRLYKKGLEIKEREDRREKLYDRLAEKYKDLRAKNKNYTLNRLILYQFDMSDDPKAEAYNENVIKNYFLHPEAMAQRECKKVMLLNPAEAAKIAKSSDMGNLLIEYYERNTEQCEHAYGLLGTVRNTNVGGIITPETKQYLEQVAPSYEVLSTASETVKTMSEEYFTMPIISDDQKETLFNTNFENEEPELNEALKKQVRASAFKNISFKQYKDFFKTMEKNGKMLNEAGAFNKYVAKSEKGGKVTYHSVISVVDGREKDAKITELNADAVNGLQRLFTRDFAAEEGFIQHDFAPSLKKSEEQIEKDFRYEYALRNNKSLAKTDGKNMSSFLKDHKGGFWERKLGKTSRQYKNFERAVNDYYNISSDKCKDRENVASAAYAYLEYKGVDPNNPETVNRLSGTARGRAIYCLSAIRACTQPKYHPEYELDYVKVSEHGIVESSPENLFGAKEKLGKEPAISDKKILEEQVTQNDVVIKQAEPVTVVPLEHDDLKI